MRSAPPSPSATSEPLSIELPRNVPAACHDPGPKVAPADGELAPVGLVFGAVGDDLAGDAPGDDTHGPTDAEDCGSDEAGGNAAGVGGTAGAPTGGGGGRAP